MPQFAFAQLKGDICLVQVASPEAMSSALMVTDIQVFRHEFITIFRYSHSMCVHPADLRVLCGIDERSALYDEEKGTVYLTKDVMDQLQKLMMAARQGSRRSRVAAPTRGVRVAGVPMTHGSAQHVTVISR